MSIQNRANLKSVFGDGDTLTEDNFADLIDSSPNLVDTTAQQFASTLIAPGLAANTVSADSGYFTVSYVGTNVHRNPYVEFYIPATAQTTAAATFAALNVITSAPNAVSFTITSGAATYTGVVTANMEINYYASLKPSHAGEIVRISVFKNGVQVVPSEFSATLAAGVTQVGGQCVTQMKPSDVVDLRVAVATTTEANYETHKVNVIIKPINWS